MYFEAVVIARRLPEALVQRHQVVYGTLGKAMGRDPRLALQVFTPEEFAGQGPY